MKTKSNKNLIDDGFNAELVESAAFTGLLEIPLVKKPSEFIVPKGMIPFSERGKSKNQEEFVCFYEHDIRFRDVLTAAREQVESLRQFPGVVSPDCSLYYDMPLVLQMANTYLNRQIGHYLQEQGLYVIPNVRWGDERSYKRILPDEPPFAFLGVERRGIVSIGTYGCIKGKENEFHFREGLQAMLAELRPEITLVYGAMPPRIFGEFKGKTRFVQYDDWTKARHKKAEAKHGQRR